MGSTSSPTTTRHRRRAQTFAGSPERMSSSRTKSIALRKPGGISNPSRGLKGGIGPDGGEPRAGLKKKLIAWLDTLYPARTPEENRDLSAIMAFLQAIPLRRVPGTFENLAHQVSQMIKTTAGESSRIEVVGNQYPVVSINEAERLQNI